MYVTSDILYSALSEKWELYRLGRPLKEQLLSLPALFTQDTIPCQNKVYIAQTYNLPAILHEQCLFICVGSRPTEIWSDWPGEVLYVADSSADLISVFNLVQSVFEGIHNWETQMQQLLEQNANVEEMLRISIPIFQNRITIIDYELRIIAYCESTEINGQKEIRLCKAFERVPHEKSRMFNPIYAQRLLERNPYFYQENGTDIYCINLYLGDVYMGCCSLMEDIRQIHEGDYLLFQHFADYICRALLAQSRIPASRFVTLKTIFSQLLQNLPVSREHLNHALSSAFKKDSACPKQTNSWICITIRSANKRKSLPGNYLCTSLEKLLPNCSALLHEGLLVAFCQCSRTDFQGSEFCQILTPYLQDMNFRAGMSMPFDDLFRSQSYYLQAKTALRLGLEAHPEQFFFSFQDYALTYMLQHSSGEFEPEVIFPPGLLQLYEYKGGADYWETLKRYLDNECNASRTASEMFLHRSTLLPRLEKIKTFVNLDTAEQRLYLRLCIYLCETLHKK